MCDGCVMCKRSTAHQHYRSSCSYIYSSLLGFYELFNTAVVSNDLMDKWEQLSTPFFSYLTDTIICPINNNCHWNMPCPNWFISQQSVGVLTCLHKHTDKNTVWREIPSNTAAFFHRFQFIIMNNEPYDSYKLSFVWHILFQCLGFAASLLPQCTWSYHCL